MRRISTHTRPKWKVENKPRNKKTKGFESVSVQKIIVVEDQTGPRPDRKNFPKLKPQKGEGSAHLRPDENWGGG